MNNLHFVIQNNLFNEEANRVLVDLLDNYGIEYTLVKVIPFNGGIEPEIEISSDKKIITIGSMSLVNYANAKGWKPGAWCSDELSYDAYIKNYGDDMLNYDSRIIPFGDVPLYFAEYRDKFFLRPVSDGKLFAGTVYSPKEFLKWYQLILKGDTMWTITPETPVLMSRFHDIYAEYRCIIMNSEVVTASMYKRGNRVHYSKDVPSDVIQYANMMAEQWSPLDVYVLDVADTPDGYQIIELNNFNSAGWYHCDVSLIIQGLDRVVNELD